VSWILTALIKKWKDGKLSNYFLFFESDYKYLRSLLLFYEPNVIIFGIGVLK